MEREEYVESYLNEVGSISKRISRRDIKKVVDLLYKAWEEGRRVFTAGNGGSASTATHFASDLAKYTAVEGKPRVRALALTDNMPLMTALINDLGWGSVFVEQLKNLMDEGDVFIAISVHGGSGTDKAGPWSQNLLAAAKYVKEMKGKVVGFAGFDGGMLKMICDASVIVPANSTPHVEGFHSVLAHLIVADLRERIERS